MLDLDMDSDVEGSKHLHTRDLFAHNMMLNPTYSAG